MVVPVNPPVPAKKTKRAMEGMDECVPLEGGDGRSEGDIRVVVVVESIGSRRARCRPEERVGLKMGWVWWFCCLLLKGNWERKGEGREADRQAEGWTEKDGVMKGGAGGSGCWMALWWQWQVLAGCNLGFFLGAAFSAWVRVSKRQKQDWTQNQDGWKVGFRENRATRARIRGWKDGG